MNTDLVTCDESLPVKRKRGRPSKQDLTKAVKPGKVGRPAGVPARINELKARLIATSGDRVLNEIVRKALDPEDKDQVACLKMCIDRVLPISMFEKGAGRSNAVQIQIINTSDKSSTVIENDDAVDIDFEEVNSNG